MRRPLETMILGYPSLLSRLESAGKPPVILDILQEVNRHACDTPTYPPEAIKGDEELGHLFKDLDFSGLDPGYASKEGIFAPESVKERAARVRKWLYDRPEKEIVGECLECLLWLTNDLLECLRVSPTRIPVEGFA